jgi:putative ABC transport system permease protein
VARYVNGPVLPGGAPVSVLGIDPATFGAFAFVDGTQRRDVGRLAARASGGTPAILVNAPAGLDPSRVRIGASRVPIAVIAHRDIFPGLSNGSRPLLVVDRAALAHVDPRAGRTNEVWTDAAQLAAVSAAIDADGYRVLSQSDTQIRVSNSGLLPITWIFGYLRALAILVGAVAVAGLAFALSARTRRRRVAYAMSRRMGLTAGTHLRSLLIELGAVVGLGWLAGTAAGVGGYALLAGSLDVQPQLPPGAALELPALSLAVTASVVALVVVIAAVGAHVGAERAHPAEILRLA